MASVRANYDVPAYRGREAGARGGVKRYPCHCLPDELLDRAADAFEDEYRRILPVKATDYADHRDGVVSALSAAFRVVVAATESNTDTRGVVPTEVYSRSLDRQGALRERVKALEAMLLDAWLAFQAGPVSGDCHRARILTKRARSWRSVLDDKLDEAACVIPASSRAVQEDTLMQAEAARLREQHERDLIHLAENEIQDARDA